MRFFLKYSSAPVTPWLLSALLALPFSAAQAQQTPPAAAAAKPVAGEVKAVRASPAVNDVLARDPAGALIKVADILAELRRARPEDREAFLAKPEKVQQLASNLLVRRLLAAEAQRDGLGADPVLMATLAISQDRILSDARLARFDAQNNPTDATLDAYARNLYQTNTTKFEKPAQTRARHILLAKGGADSLQKARELVAKLRTGASFEELAKTHSTDTASAVRGGDLGFFEAGKMVQPFEDALNKLAKPGDLSEPVESEFGYHIIRLEERQEKSVQPYSEVRTQLLQDARNAILTEHRLQKVKALTQNFVYEPAALDALARTVTP